MACGDCVTEYDLCTRIIQDAHYILVPCGTEGTSGDPSQTCQKLVPPTTESYDCNPHQVCEPPCPPPETYCNPCSSCGLEGNWPNCTAVTPGVPPTDGGGDGGSQCGPGEILVGATCYPDPNQEGTCYPPMPCYYCTTTHLCCNWQPGGVSSDLCCTGLDSTGQWGAEECIRQCEDCHSKGGDCSGISVYYCGAQQPCNCGTPAGPPPADDLTCDLGYEGTKPNCVCVVPSICGGGDGDETPTTCPAGYTGTPPNCTPAVCQEGYQGTPPNCTLIPIETWKTYCGPEMVLVDTGVPTSEPFPEDPCADYDSSGGDDQTTPGGCLPGDSSCWAGQQGGTQQTYFVAKTTPTGIGYMPTTMPGSIITMPDGSISVLTWDNLGQPKIIPYDDAVEQGLISPYSYAQLYGPTSIGQYAAPGVIPGGGVTTWEGPMKIEWPTITGQLETLYGKKPGAATGDNYKIMGFDGSLIDTGMPRTGPEPTYEQALAVMLADKAARSPTGGNHMVMGLDGQLIDSGMSKTGPTPTYSQTLAIISAYEAKQIATTTPSTIVETKMVPIGTGEKILVIQDLSKSAFLTGEMAGSVEILSPSTIKPIYDSIPVEEISKGVPLEPIQNQVTKLSEEVITPLEGILAPGFPIWEKMQTGSFTTTAPQVSCGNCSTEDIDEALEDLEPGQMLQVVNKQGNFVGFYYKPEDGGEAVMIQDRGNYDDKVIKDIKKDAQGNWVVEVIDQGKTLDGILSSDIETTDKENGKFAYTLRGTDETMYFETEDEMKKAIEKAYELGGLGGSPEYYDEKTDEWKSMGDAADLAISREKVKSLHSVQYEMNQMALQYLQAGEEDKYAWALEVLERASELVAEDIELTPDMKEATGEASEILRQMTYWESDLGTVPVTVETEDGEKVPVGNILQQGWALIDGAKKAAAAAYYEFTNSRNQQAEENGILKFTSTEWNEDEERRKLEKAGTTGLKADVVLALERLTNLAQNRNEYVKDNEELTEYGKLLTYKGGNEFKENSEISKETIEKTGMTGNIGKSVLLEYMDPDDIAQGYINNKDKVLDQIFEYGTGSIIREKLEQIETLDKNGNKVKAFDIEGDMGKYFETMNGIQRLESVKNVLVDAVKEFAFAPATDNETLNAVILVGSLLPIGTLAGMAAKGGVKTGAKATLKMGLAEMGESIFGLDAAMSGAGAAEKGLKFIATGMSKNVDGAINAIQETADLARKMRGTPTTTIKSANDIDLTKYDSAIKTVAQVGAPTKQTSSIGGALATLITGNKADFSTKVPISEVINGKIIDWDFRTAIKMPEGTVWTSTEKAAKATDTIKDAISEKITTNKAITELGKITKDPTELNAIVTNAVLNAGTTANKTKLDELMKKSPEMNQIITKAIGNIQSVVKENEMVQDAGVAIVRKSGSTNITAVEKALDNTPLPTIKTADTKILDVTTGGRINAPIADINAGGIKKGDVVSISAPVKSGETITQEKIVFAVVEDMKVVDGKTVEVKIRPATGREVETAALKEQSMTRTVTFPGQDTKLMEETLTSANELDNKVKILMGDQKITADAGIKAVNDMRATTFAQLSKTPITDAMKRERLESILNINDMILRDAKLVDVQEEFVKAVNVGLFDGMTAAEREAVQLPPALRSQVVKLDETKLRIANDAINVPPTKTMKETLDNAIERGMIDRNQASDIWQSTMAKQLDAKSMVDETRQSIINTMAGTAKVEGGYVAADVRMLELTPLSKYDPSVLKTEITRAETLTKNALLDVTNIPMSEQMRILDDAIAMAWKGDSLENIGYMVKSEINDIGDLGLTGDALRAQGFGNFKTWEAMATDNKNWFMDVVEQGDNAILANLKNFSDNQFEKVMQVLDLTKVTPSQINDLKLPPIKRNAILSEMTDAKKMDGLSNEIEDLQHQMNDTFDKLMDAADETEKAKYKTEMNRILNNLMEKRQNLNKLTESCMLKHPETGCTGIGGIGIGTAAVAAATATIAAGLMMTQPADATNYINQLKEDDTVRVVDVRNMGDPTFVPNETYGKINEITKQIQQMNVPTWQKDKLECVQQADWIREQLGDPTLAIAAFYATEKENFAHATLAIKVGTNEYGQGITSNEYVLIDSNGNNLGLASKLESYNDAAAGRMVTVTDVYIVDKADQLKGEVEGIAVRPDSAVTAYRQQTMETISKNVGIPTGEMGTKVIDVTGGPGSGSSRLAPVQITKRVAVEEVTPISETFASAPMETPSGSGSGWDVLMNVLGG